jgi:hypothetical protein
MHAAKSEGKGRGGRGEVYRSDNKSSDRRVEVEEKGRQRERERTVSMDTGERFNASGWLAVLSRT